jgi:GT2 family glycosyltransferase
MIEAAIIIPHYNDTARLLRCLDRLMPMVRAANGDVEVVIVDNGSTESLDVVRGAHPDLHIVSETIKGAAAARNRGVRETTAPQLFFLDADCVPASDWLPIARRVSMQADVVGGTVTLFDETPRPRSGAEAFETVFAFDNKRYIEKKGFSVTANLLTSRDVFAAVGDMVPGVSEDMDWCHRVTAKGFSLTHVDALRVEHPTRSDWAALHKKWHRITEESFALTGSRLGWSLRGLAMLPSIPVHVLRILCNSELGQAGEKRAAVATLARLRITRARWMLRQSLGLNI